MSKNTVFAYSVVRDLLNDDRNDGREFMWGKDAVSEMDGLLQVICNEVGVMAQELAEEDGRKTARASDILDAYARFQILIKGRLG